MLRTTATILAASALGLAACEERPATRTNNTTTTTPTRPTTPPTTTADADRKLADDIRRAIADDSVLPATAKNITITVNNGEITLRGVVATQAEKDAVETRVKSVAGAGRVNNELEVKSS